MNKPSTNQLRLHREDTHNFLRLVHEIGLLMRRTQSKDLILHTQMSIDVLPEL